jgi:hypothetical protein
MSTPEVTWVKVGKFEHNLPKGKHVIYSATIDTETVTAAQLEVLFKKKSPHVRQAVTPKKEEPTTK